MTTKHKKSLGESLVDAGLITADQLKDAQAEEQRSGNRMRKVVVQMGFIDEGDLVEFLSENLGLPRIDLSNFLVDQKIIELIPEELARKYELVPVLKIGNRLTCAMVDPWNIFALDEIGARANLIIEPAVATENEIKKALNEYYGVKGSMESLIKSIDTESGAADKITIDSEKDIDIKRLHEMTEEPVVIKLVNLVIMKAIQEGASDIHVEPEDKTLTIRLRVDGVLHAIDSPPKYLQSALLSRLKIMATLDITERRVPQDGRFTIRIEDKAVDVRVSSVPTIYGENIVLRLLDATGTVLQLTDLGFPKTVLDRFDKLITRPHGIILVTGPTGSGKTTTLYASLCKINTVEKNIITIEDPVEYKLAGIRQIQVNPKVNLTFANGLRSILRQDPNIVMVGEIRDPETAEIAIHAALTGHLVFSTLHTNDAAGAITRLVDMGVEPFLASSSVIGVLAQRLVRTICPDCKEKGDKKYAPSAESLKDLGLSPDDKINFIKAKGCPKCLDTGYKGRIGIYELLAVDDRMRAAIVAKTPADELKKLAVAAGMVTLMQDGIEKVRQGITTVEEVLRVTREE